MKQVAQNYKTGDLQVLDVPAPACRPGGVLVRSLYSLISTGTEVMKVTEANLKGRMNVKLGLFYGQNAQMFANTAYDHRDHLRYSDTDIAWCNSDAPLKIAQSNLRSATERCINFLQFAEVVLGKTALEQLVKPARNWHFLELKFSRR